MGSCDVDGNKLQDANVASVCDGGTASSCADNKPFLVNSGLSMGFAAAAVGGVNGLNGDENCGQCYELRFTDEKHDPNGDNWGGSHPDLAGKTMVIQVTNIGYDVTGDHSFDLQIPGAGQGIFDQGCKKQFPGHGSGDFDCDNNYGGCDTKSGCSRLPEALQAGCEWRYDWYRWLAAGGQTNNPYVQFRRVQCPSQLTDISGSVPTDDASYPAINVNDYGPSPSPSRTPGTTTPAPAPTPTSCAAEDEDPYSTGSEVQCCDGLEKCLGDWSGNGNWHYNCKPSCGRQVGSPSTPAPSSTPEPTSTPAPTTSTPAPTPTPGSSTAAEVWGQCGGRNWQGPSECVAGATCQRNNDWYSQCLPASSASLLSRKRTFVKAQQHIQK